MDLKKQKKIDGVLNPIWKFIYYLGYLLAIPIVAFGVVFFDFFILNKLSINEKSIMNFNQNTMNSLLLFFLGTMVFTILIDFLISKIINRKNKNNTLDQGILYDFMYEVIDNVFKCLSFMGILFQVIKQQDKIFVIIIFGLIIGIQQFIIKAWIKTIRKFQDIDFVQTLSDAILSCKSRKTIKKCINKFEEAKGNTSSKIYRQMIEKSLKEIFEILYKDEVKEAFNRYYKTQNIVKILDGKELKECKEKFEHSKDKSGINVDKIARELKKIKKYL